MNTRAETFRKSERLTSRKTITRLFDEGEIFYTPLLKIVWCRTLTDNPSYAGIAFSVSKKSFRNAVDRNLLKRRMRESYRHNKHLLYEALESAKIKIAFMIIYRGNRIASYQEIDKSLSGAISCLIAAIGEKQINC